MMKRPDQIKARLDLLFLALCYSRQIEPMFTTIDRIMINQERAGLLRAIEHPDNEIRPVSPRLEAKINDIQAYANRTGWRPLNKDPFI